MTDLVGRDLGRYHILQQLGEGGMATVYKAYDTRVESDVAVKVIRMDKFTPELLGEALLRFEREAKALARLTHPNIVKVMDYGEYENQPYLVMPFLPGGTLKQKLTGKPVPYREAVGLLIPIARALDYAHQQGMIHRDVKPSNILITQSGEPMLTDFGVAKILDEKVTVDLTGSNATMGTPEYMAPEQVVSKNVDHRADIYAFGVVLYEMITGRKPYVADTPIAVLFKHASDPLPPPRQFVADLPDEVQKLLIKALMKKPEDRYQSMGEMAKVMESLLQGSQPAESPDATYVATAQPAAEIPGTPITVKQPALKRKRPRWLGAAIGGAAALLLLAAGAVVGLPYLLKSLAPAPTRAAAPTIPALPTAIRTLAPTLVQAGPPQPAATVTTISAPLAIAQNCLKTELFCVGMVTDVSGIDDRSFNQSVWEGIQAARSNGLVDEIQFLESTDAGEYEMNIATFAEANFDVIVTAGFALTEATTAAAEMHPKIFFIGVDQVQGGKTNNLVGLSFPEDRAGFLVGALAAAMSNTHKIGAVCGSDQVPPVWRYCEGYRAGAAYADARFWRETQVLVVYHNDVGLDTAFNDPFWGSQTADSMIASGADVIFGAAGKTGNGAIIEAASRGFLVIGVDNDQYFTLPEAAPRLLSSAMKVIPPGVVELIRLARNAQGGTGTFPTGDFPGEAGFAPYHDLESEVPATVREMMEVIRAGLLDGTLLTNVPPARP